MLSGAMLQLVEIQLTFSVVLGFALLPFLFTKLTISVGSLIRVKSSAQWGAWFVRLAEILRGDSLAERPVPLALVGSR